MHGSRINVNGNESNNLKTFSKKSELGRIKNFLIVDNGSVIVNVSMK